MKTRLFIAACAGALVGVVGLGGMAFATPSYVVSPGLHGLKAQPTVGVYEQSGEYDYYRDFVTADVSVKGATVNYEEYTTSYEQTTQRNQTITVKPTGVSYRDSLDDYNTYANHSVDTTSIDTSDGVLITKESNADGCTTGTSVHLRPVKDPANPTVTEDGYC